MLNAFSTHNGMSHVSAIVIDGTPLFHMLVEPSLEAGADAAVWRWRVWSAFDPGGEPDISYTGTAPTLEDAKWEAVDTAVVILAELTMGDDEYGMAPPSPMPDAALAPSSPHATTEASCRSTRRA